MPPPIWKDMRVVRLPSGRLFSLLLEQNRQQPCKKRGCCFPSIFKISHESLFGSILTQHHSKKRILGNVVPASPTSRKAHYSLVRLLHPSALNN